MKERPIIFNTEMIQAILEGRKTQTRRVITPQPDPDKLNIIQFTGPHPYSWPFTRNDGKADVCPYGVPRDLLWVRETFAVLGWWEGDVPVHTIGDDDVIYYQEFPDFNWVDGDGFTEYREDGSERSHWKPSIHMPKKFCRIWLKVKGVRVERLQDISEEDAVAEGVLGDETEFDQATPRMCFELLWNSINSARGFGWDKNPWVWVIEFERIER